MRRRYFRVAVLDKDGNAVIEKIRRPRLLSELPEDLQRLARCLYSPRREPNFASRKVAER
jgi:hypothetical protein